MYRDRMLAFFRNTFQQTGFNPAEDFKPQLLTNGGFDFAGDAAATTSSRGWCRTSRTASP